MPTLHRTTRIAVCSCVAVLAGCARKENAAVDTSSAMASSTASTTSVSGGTLNLADVAGKWNMKAVPMSGDTTPTNYVLTATSNTSGWTITFPGRPPIPVKKVSVDGDSVMLSAGPYESVRRRGVQVTTYGVARLQSGTLTGSTTAHYKTRGADSVLVLTTSGTRAQ
jgi:hypothetical protein